MDGDDLYEPAHVLHLRTPRTPLLRHHQAEYGIRHQPHHERYGTGHGLVWRTLRKGLQQIRGNASDTGEKHRSQRASYRGITALHRMPGKGDYGSRFARHVYSADVVNVRADTRNLNPETGKLELAETNPLVSVHGGYYELGEKIGKFGWSVEKKK